MRLESLARPLALALAAAAAALALAWQAPSASASSPCNEWGKVEPQKLITGQARKAVLCLVNRERDKAGLPALDRSKKLQKAAQRHNDRMAGTGCFDHTCGGEASLTDRLENVGYLGGGLTRWVYGENIAWGMGSLGTPEKIVDAWMASPGHRANILNRSYREIGVGFSQGTPNRSGAPGGIYTTDFGLAVG